MTASRIHVYTVCWNEEYFLPFFLRHYLAFAERVVLYDNDSTDGTVRVASAHPRVEVRRFDTCGQYDEVKQTALRNSAYKESKGVADWVMVVDIDEIIHHPSLLELLDTYKRMGVTLPRTEGYEMISSTPPTAEDDIRRLVRRGIRAPAMDKKVVFDPRIDINFGLGSHICHPPGQVKEADAQIKLLHYRCLGEEYMIHKYLARNARATEFCRNNKCGVAIANDPHSLGVPIPVSIYTPTLEGFIRRCHQAMLAAATEVV